MGTDKRQRQKANRAMRQAEQARAARTDAVKRNVLLWVIGGIAAIGAVVLIAWIGGAFDGDESEPDSPVLTIAPETTLDPTLTVPSSTASTTPSSAPESTVASTSTTAP